MPRTDAELRHDAAQAREKIESKGALIALANKRAAKWDAKRDAAKRELAQARKGERPNKVRVAVARLERAQRKLVYWKRRKHDAIYLRTHWQRILTDAVGRLAARKAPGEKLLATALEDVGEREGGKAHRDAAEFIGAETGWPWCSTIVGWWLHKALGYTRSELPATAPYSGCWAAWAGGKRVAISSRRPGDIVIFDWGDGGMSDHVAVAKSTAEHVGGNQADAVNIRPTLSNAIVFVVRPRARRK